MMTLEDYALDVNKTIDEIKALCDKIGINYEDENSLLDETDIILLDNEQQDEEDYVTPGDEDALEEQRLEEEVEDIAEELALDTKFDLDNSSSFFSSPASYLTFSRSITSPSCNEAAKFLASSPTTSLASLTSKPNNLESPAATISKENSGLTCPFGLPK